MEKDGEELNAGSAFVGEGGYIGILCIGKSKCEGI